jgi:predicted Zn finger-like uncharacterized protein
MATIIRCANCKGLLKVDVQSLPEKGSVKVRCPHCRIIGSVAVGTGLSGPVLEDAQSKGSDSGEYPLLVTFQEKAGLSSHWDEATLPHDAFKRFRFPAEGAQEQAAPQKTVAKRSSILWWALASVAVVALFALLVNIILPGPLGSKAVRALPKQELLTPEVPQQGSERSH